MAGSIVHVRFFNDGPVEESGRVWPKNSLVPVTEERAQSLVRTGCAEIVPGNGFEDNPGACSGTVTLSQRFSIVPEIPRNDDARVGIVIPAYNPGRFLAACLQSIADSDAKDICEVVVVDDASQPPIAREAVELMVSLGICGKVVRLRTNHEFAKAVNIGAQCVAGDHLLMLNVDIEVKPNFLQPMLDVLESDDKIAVVGNLHRTPGGGVDSAGSEWSWTSCTFQHRGRDIQADVTKPAELDMVTWACCLVRRTIWDRLGGLADDIYTAYWEDTDFCMSVRRLGYRICYTPESVIIHRGKHAALAGKPRDHHSDRGAAAFHRRWVWAGAVEEFARRRGVRLEPTRIIVGMITLNEEEFIRAAIESVYDAADLIVVPVGAVDRAVAAGLCEPNGYPTDATMDILRDFPDPANKLVIDGPRMWGPEKSAMRNAVLDRCQHGDMVVMLDADEVMYPGAMWKLFAALRHADVLRPEREDHWNDLDTVATGHGWQRIWEPRIFRFRQGMRYTTNHGRPDNLGPRDKKLDYSPWAHYAYVKPIEKLRCKVDYYRQVYSLRDIDPGYIDNVFLRWREEPEAVEAGPGTYVLRIFRDCGTRPLDKRHPPEIEKLILEGVIPGADW